MTALVAALIGGGCGSSSEDAPSQRAATATTTTATPARTSTMPGSTASGDERTGGSTTTTSPRSDEQARSPVAPQPTTTTPPAKPGRSTPAKLGKPQTFSGDRERVIGRLVLKRNAVVRWKVTGGGAFTVRDAGDKLKISGRGTSGQTFAESGEYRSVKVTASGRWTLSFATLGA